MRIRTDIAILLLSQRWLPAASARRVLHESPCRLAFPEVNYAH